MEIQRRLRSQNNDQDCPGCINKSLYRAGSTAKPLRFPLYGCLQCLTRVCFAAFAVITWANSPACITIRLTTSRWSGRGIEMQAFAYQRTAIDASCYRCALPRSPRRRARLRRASATTPIVRPALRAARRGGPRSPHGWHRIRVGSQGPGWIQ